MKKSILLMLTVTLLLVLGCGANPIEPTRKIAGTDDECLVFQRAVMMVRPDLGCNTAIPVNVPLSQIVPQKNFPLFASYALSAFNIYCEPSYWGNSTNGEFPGFVRTVFYKPVNWDDWLLGNRESGSTPSRQAYGGGNSSEWLEEIGEWLDPDHLFNPTDWYNWLDPMWEPSDWDDWLASHTIEDIIALN